MKFNDNFNPDEKLTNEEGYILVIPEYRQLYYRRKELGLTQQQVADAASINLRQYQRLESGERSMRSATLKIALSVCHVLQLDPYRFVPEVYS